MRTRLAAVALLGSLALAPSERIEFGPAPGTSVGKRFETELEVSVDRLMQFSGRDGFHQLIDTRALLGLEARASSQLDLDDAYLESRGGRPIGLARTYRRLVAHAATRLAQEPGFHIDWDLNRTSELDVDAIEDATVEFAWDESTGTYARVPADGDELDRDLLDALTEDLDLRTLLPEEGEPPADRWSVAWPRLAPVALPGLLGRNVAAPTGLLPWLPDDLPASIGRAFQHQYATCTRDGTRLIGIDECAVVRFRSEPRGDLELRTLPGETSVFEMYGWRMVLSRFDAEIAADLNGELLWSLEQRRFRSLEIAGDLTLEGTFTLRLDRPNGTSEEASFDLKLSGDVRWSASAETVAAPPR